MGRKKDPTKVTQRDRLNTTTVDIDKALKVRVQIRAVELGITVRDAIEEAVLRFEAELDRRVEKKRREDERKRR